MQKLLLSFVCAAVVEDRWSCRIHQQALVKRRSNDPAGEHERAGAASPMAETGVLISRVRAGSLGNEIVRTK
jgi:hypothetical protein